MATIGGRIRGDSMSTVADIDVQLAMLNDEGTGDSKRQSSKRLSARMSTRSAKAAGAEEQEEDPASANAAPTATPSSATNNTPQNKLYSAALAPNPR